MPSDVVSLVVSTGLGVSVLAGIISGACYILACRINNKRNSKTPDTEWRCAVCKAHFRSIKGILEGNTVVTCERCGKSVCKIRCSKLQNSLWTCNVCTEKSWILGGIFDFDWRTMQANDTPTTKRDEIKEKIRDFIEKLVSNMIGESVDDASINRIYNDHMYSNIFEKYHRDLSNVLTDLGSSLHISLNNLPSNQLPSNAHVALKTIIERLLRDSQSLPELGESYQSTGDHDQSDRSYEDLLATAIINKVISSTQSNRTPSCSASVSSKISVNSRHKEFFFGDETLDDKWKTDAETTSISSLDDWIYSDSSFGTRKFVDRETLTIQQLIEEDVDSENDSENGEADADEVDTNWVLQRKQFHGTNSPVPVPMLVPKPTVEAKVLIGDKEIDETSDLSDVESDFCELDPLPNQQTLLLSSKTLIGGKNRLVQNGSDGESSSVDSGVKELRDKSGYDDPIEEYVVKADITIDDDNVEDASILSVYSNTEKENEYTEKYASLPRTVTKSPVPAVRHSKKDVPEPKKRIQNVKVETDDEDEDVLINFSGQYSKREKEKWKHAIEMKNNPYTKENIEKRITRSRSAASSIFGPDYYARLASTPSGGKIKSPEVREAAWPPKSPQENDFIETTEDKIIETNNNCEDQEDMEEVFENHVEITNNNEVDAKVNLTNDNEVNAEINSTSDNEVNLTSDSDLSYVNFYDVENAKVYKKTKEELEELNPEYKQPETRPHFLKLKSINAPQAHKFHTSTNLRRHRSESDLIEDSFDAPPRILGRKKDNTLISKIYSQAHVRNFAMSSRNNVPVDIPKISTFRNLNDGQRYNGKSGAYYSDDGGNRNNVYSSQEDLKFSSATNLNVRNYSISSEDDFGSKGNKFSSNEDLLSIEEEKKVEPMKNGEILPYDPSKFVEIEQASYESAFIERDIISPDPEINELAKRKIVHQVLEQISENKPVVATWLNSREEKTEMNNNKTISVKELRKMFETKEKKNTVHSSLTGRSLSKQMRDNLKN